MIKVFVSLPSLKYTELKPFKIYLIDIIAELAFLGVWFL